MERWKSLGVSLLSLPMNPGKRVQEYTRVTPSMNRLGIRALWLRSLEKKGLKIREGMLL